LTAARRAWVVAFVVVFLLAALVAGVAVSRSRRFTTGPPLAPAYTIVYREETLTPTGPVARWESLSVHRPYRAADLLYATPALGSPISGTIATEDALYDVRPGRPPLLVGGRQPGVPTGDQDLLTQLPDLMSRGLAADLRSSRVVAGRSCRMYRLLEPPSGPIKPLAGPGNSDDMCIASGGLVLSEQWTLDGSVVLTRVAIRAALVAGPIPSTAGAESAPGLSPATIVTSPQTLLAPPPAPPGFRARPVVELLLQNPFGPRPASVTFAFADGAHTISVEAGTGPPPWQDGDTVTRRAGLRIGHGTSALRSDGGEVRVDAGGGRWVRVRGSVPVRSLVSYAGELRLRSS
jgi:hypothetical protein